MVAERSVYLQRHIFIYVEKIRSENVDMSSDNIVRNKNKTMSPSV